MSLEVSSPVSRSRLKPTGMKSGVRCLQVFRSTSCTPVFREQSQTRARCSESPPATSLTLGTFRETKKTRELTYFNREGGTYRVRVVLHRASGRLETFKYKGRKLVACVSGNSFESAMAQTTLVGIEQDEPVTVVRDSFHSREGGFMVTLRCSASTRAMRTARRNNRKFRLTCIPNRMRRKRAVTICGHH